MLRFLTPLVLFMFLLSGQTTAIEVLSDPISAERPLLIFAAPGASEPDSLAHADRILSAWQTLPQALRPYSVLQIESPVTDDGFWPDRFTDVLRELQFSSVPVIVSIANGDPESIYPLDQLRVLLEQFSVIRGVHVEGLSFNEVHRFGDLDPLGIPPQVQWLRGAIEVVGEFGRLITIELDELNWPRVMSSAWCRPLYESIRAHSANVVPLNGQRGPHNLTRSSALMGLWLEGAVDQWGLECSSDWYASAGFVEPGVFGRGVEETVMPASIYRAMILNGAIAGAAVYRFDRVEDLWSGAPNAYWSEAIEPTLSEVLARGYIARKDLVQGRIKIAYRLNPSENAEEFRANLVDIDGVYGEGFMLHGAYGMERPGQVPELVPNTGRHYWIPIVSPYAPDEVLRQFEEVILPGAMLDAQAWRERLGLYYSGDGDGNAFIAKIGRAIFVLHTRENLYEEQVFRLRAAPAPVRGITAQRRVDGISLTWPFREGDLFYQVYRRVLPETEFTLVASDIDVRRYLDVTAGSDDTVAYSVTALTNEREPFESTVNFGDYLVFSSATSRIDEEVLLDPFTSSATSTPLPPKIDTRAKEQIWWPTGMELLTPAETTIATTIAARIEAWEEAFRAEDLGGVMDFYTSEYEDAEGNTIESTWAAYRIFFDLYRAGHVERQIRAWDFSAFADTGEVGLTLYCRFNGLDEVGPTGRYADLPVFFPDVATGEVRLTFANRDNAWRIHRSDTPLPSLDDILPGR